METMNSYALGSWDALKGADPEVCAAIEAEEIRQREKLLLIASKNFASPAVLAAQGSLLTNKYAEGYPGKRYYGGCQHADVVEDLAIQRCKRSSARSTSMCSRIPGHRPTWRLICLS